MGSRSRRTLHLGPRHVDFVLGAAGPLRGCEPGREDLWVTELTRVRGVEGEAGMRGPGSGRWQGWEGGRREPRLGGVGAGSWPPWATSSRLTRGRGGARVPGAEWCEVWAGGAGVRPARSLRAPLLWAR